MISRFVNCDFLLDSDVMRQKYLSLLGAGVEKTDAVLLGYCLMSSHIHLVVRAGEEPLERMMKSIHSGYAGYVNRVSPKRIGPVFAGRYKAVLVEEDEYLLELIRYVHNNPVRGGVVLRARESNWSSHQAYVGDVNVPKWLNCGYVLSMFNDKAGWARRQFERFVDEGLDETRRKDLNGEEQNIANRRFESAVGDGWRLSGPVVGSDQFAAKVMNDLHQLDKQVVNGIHVKSAKHRQRPELSELVGVTCAELGIEPWEFEAQPKKKGPALARRIIVYLWVGVYGGRQAEVVRFLKANSGAVARWYTKSLAEIGEIEPLCDKIKAQFPTILSKEEKSQRVRYSFEIE
ncbi:MAG: transposase [Deltaproteobacteria bacterium]|nr:transposase [Deltaproteobacteria bacterium]